MDSLPDISQLPGQPSAARRHQCAHPRLRPPAVSAGAGRAVMFPYVSDLWDGGLLQSSEERWQLTPQGVLRADSVFATFP